VTQPFQFRVEESSAGQRLDEFLAARLVSLSRMRIARLVERGGCAVNGAAAHEGHRLSAGDLVEAALSDETPNAMTPEAVPLEIVFEDEHMVVVVKPAGVLVHPTLGVKTGTLANALAYHLNRLRIAEFGLRIEAKASPSPDEGEGEGRSEERRDVRSSNPQSAIPNPQSEWVRPGLVHRLDRDTSGLLVVAKTQRALSRLSQHFQRRLVEKRYHAVLGGLVGADERTINAPVGRDAAARPAWRVAEGGRQALTRLRVLERRGPRTLVELEPLTGRTNQLRIHCAHAGHAIVGDRLYGGEQHARLCLHASRLAFRHPATNEPVEFSSRLPPEVEAALGGGDRAADFRQSR
jgi:23S rRNA pseudouridine1911/1915/1917 synthase